MTLIAIVVLVVCVAFKVYVIHNCPSHPLYRRSALFTVESEKGLCWVYAAVDVVEARAAVDARHAEEIAAKDREIADLKRKRVTKRELREYQDIEGDALTLRSYIKEQGETPMMTASLLKKATVELTTLREQLAAVQQERDEKAAMHSELATLAGSAIVLATLDTLAGERPTQEPEHALPAAVWRLVQERDEARAANTANLREMVGMAGRFRQTLQTVRACIVALTPGHRTGYDWNADPLYLTRKEGEALSAIDAALSSPSTQEPPRCTACGACEPFLKDGETPAECIARNRADTQAVMSLLAAAKLQLEVQTESPRDVKDRDGKTIIGKAQHERVEAENTRLRAALEALIRAVSVVVSFAQSWEPLSPGDIKEMKQANDAARAALKGDA